MLFVVCCVLFVVCLFDFLFDVRCSSCVVCLGVVCLFVCLFVVGCVLFACCWLLFVGVRCLLLGVR